MNVPDEQPAPAKVQQPKSTVQEVQPSNFYWLLIIGGCLCLVLGWFLPWFLGFGGSGYAPMDVIVSSPQGLAEICIYVMAVCMVGIIGISFWDKIRPHLARRLDLTRTALSVAGLVATVVAWAWVSLFNLPNDFGNVSHAVTNSAVWLTMFGYATLSFVFVARGFVFRRPNVAFGITFGIFFLLLP